MLDLLLHNGQIIDPVDGIYQGNIGIKGDRIVLVSEEELAAAETIDLQGLEVSPGFIDIHTHENKVDGDQVDLTTFEYGARMGVTTAVAGNCGINLSGNSIVDYFDRLEQAKLPLNLISFIGYGFLRDQLGYSEREQLQKKDIPELEAYLHENLGAGACGISLGLEYTPGVSTEEVFNLGNFLVKNYPGKLLTAHYRYDASRSLEAIAEMIIAARETGVPFQISHIGSCAAFGQMEAGLEMLTAARKAGVDISADVYPYAAFSTFIGSEVFAPGCFERWDKSYDSLLVVTGKYQGQRCTEEIFTELRENAPDTLIAAFVMEEEEVIAAIQQPELMVASDALISEGGGHPRATGTFPRLLGKYVREESILDLQEAIAKITLLPAQRMGLSKKGRIKPGYTADLTIFSREDIIDNSTYEEPLKAPSGIEHVIVNGRFTVKNGEYQGGGPGKIIRE
ncbi:MAG: N-acyl-D-amino-acid deacylase family protein [Bacillota bacterium]